MTSRLSLAILVACLVAAPDVAVAQVPGGDVTLKVPLNLTKLSADIVKVRVTCTLASAAMTANSPDLDPHRMSRSNEVPATNGQVVGTATLVFSNFTLTNPAGATATYICSLYGIDKTPTTQFFLDSSTFPQFRVTPTPAELRGTFAW